jgi:hypothetical protein
MVAETPGASGTLAARESSGDGWSLREVESGDIRK